MNVQPNPNEPALPGTTLPAHTATQGFHLGQLAALRGALQLLCESPTDSREQLETAIMDCWARYIQATAGSASEASALQTAGVPVQIRIDPSQDVPVAVWPEEKQVLTDAWGLFVIPATSPDQRPLKIAGVFHSVDPTTLPEGTTTATIRDARHTAIAVLSVIFGSQTGDCRRQIEGVSALDGWKRLLALRTWYLTAAAASLNHLPEDQVRNWPVPSKMVLKHDDMATAARLVEATGSTILAQKAVALLLAAEEYARLLKEAEEKHPRDHTAASLMVCAGVRAHRQLLEQQLEGMNNALALSLQKDPQSFDAHVLFAANTRDLPKLALIPRSARVAPIPLPV